jgi:hypothetical protein
VRSRVIETNWLGGRFRRVFPHRINRKKYGQDWQRRAWGRPSPVNR